MSSEAAFLALLRDLARDPAARGLADDVAVLTPGDRQLALTADTIVEGVHYRPDDPPADIGWKLAAVNLSDLAAKGATPVGCLMSYALSGDEAWDRAFLAGLAEALDAHAMPLLGGDTVRMPAGAPRVLGLTAIGAVAAGQAIPSRAGARPGDMLWIGGPVGDAGAGLARLITGETDGPLVRAYRRPMPQLALGQAVAPIAHAMLDISDGLLIDAARLGVASGVGVVIEHVPLSAAYRAARGDDVAARIAAASAGDDYLLLFALPPRAPPPGDAIRVGHCAAGQGLRLILDGMTQPLPAPLGWEH
jgi:thiamine-monophosphate kinase